MNAETLRSFLRLSLRMHFTNITIPINELPNFANVELTKLEKEYLKVQRITYIIYTIIMLFIFFAMVFFIKRFQEDYIIIPAALIFIIITISGWVITRLNFLYSGYALREKDVLYRTGWFIRKISVVPINRVQHVSVQSGPIERKFGIASVSIFTAGAEQADLTIHGIAKETALKIKDWITDQLHGINNEN